MWTWLQTWFQKEASEGSCEARCVWYFLLFLHPIIGPISGLFAVYRYFYYAFLQASELKGRLDSFLSDFSCRGSYSAVFWSFSTLVPWPGSMCWFNKLARYSAINPQIIRTTRRNALRSSAVVPWSSMFFRASEISDNSPSGRRRYVISRRAPIRHNISQSRSKLWLYHKAYHLQVLKL